MKTDIIIYTRCRRCEHKDNYLFPECPSCDDVRKFLDERQIDYEEIDVSEYDEILEGKGDMFQNVFVPLVRINGRFTSGFNKERLERMLKNLKK
jgi:glutaredoxin